MRKFHPDYPRSFMRIAEMPSFPSIYNTLKNLGGTVKVNDSVMLIWPEKIDISIRHGDLISIYLDPNPAISLKGAGPTSAEVMLQGASMMPEGIKIHCKDMDDIWIGLEP